MDTESRPRGQHMVSVREREREREREITRKGERESKKEENN